jgi:hypothetical protein
MKTTEEWFNSLKEDYRAKALNNMKNPKAEHFSLAGAISNGFDWKETPEGKDYWNSVFREIMYGEKFEQNLTIQPTNKIVESDLIEVRDTSQKVNVSPQEPIMFKIPKVTEVTEVTFEEKEISSLENNIEEDKSNNLFYQYKLEIEAMKENSNTEDNYSNNLFEQYKLEKESSK